MNLTQAREALEAAYPFPQFECDVNVETSRSKYTNGKVEHEFTVGVWERQRERRITKFHDYGGSLSALVAQAVAHKNAEQVNPVDVADCATEEHAR